MGVFGRRGRLLWYRGWLLPVVALVLAGCATMPSGGEVRKVGDGQRAEADSQVRVFGIPPHPNESALDIVSGFLEATTSGEPDFATAKKYLTPETAAHWNPFAKITVLSGGLRSQEDAGSITHKEGYAVVDVSGTKAAVVDARHAYRPEGGTFRTLFNVVRHDNKWRIDDLQDGLVLSEPDFQRIYHSVNTFYFARVGTDADRTSSALETLVADPVYLRLQESDPLVSTVSALLAGPTDWLAPVVSTAAPAGVRLYEKGTDRGVTVDDSQHLKVRLDASGDRLRGARCIQLAAQLYATVQAQTSGRLASAQVLREDGATACTLPGSQARYFGPRVLVGAQEGQYFIGSGSQRRLMALTRGGTDATPVPGPFGAPGADLASAAVRRDERMAAGVRRSGVLVVASLIDDKPFIEVLPRKGHAQGGGLSAPSWDGFGDLWVADRAPAGTRLLMLRGGTGKPNEVAVPGLTGRVEALRVASDGVRIALVVRQGRVQTLQLGRITRGGTMDRPWFSVAGLRTLTPPEENVTSVSWAGPSRLVVLGTEPGGVQQIQYISTDGSAAPAIEGISTASSVAGSEDQSRPLLASYAGSVYRLPGDGGWKRVRPPGDSPVYPG